MSTRQFKKHVEDFTCQRCAQVLRGSGYTNHCPKCLWSKHVDVNPGDRAERCGGMMAPIGLEGSSPHYRIVHRCELCGARRIVDASALDDPSALVALARGA